MKKRFSGAQIVPVQTARVPSLQSVSLSGLLSFPLKKLS